VNLAQAGGDSQAADVTTDAQTNVSTQQNVAAINEPTVIQNCNVQHGVCLQFIGKGKPTVTHGTGKGAGW
jgi:hypothetical protein